MALATDSTDLVFGCSAVGDGDLVLRRLEGVESISRLYEFEIDVTTNQSGPIDDSTLDAILGGTAYVAFGADETDKIHGIVRRIEMVSMSEPQPVVYRLWFVPRLWNLTVSSTTRVFQNATVPDVVRQVLSSEGFEENRDFQMAISATHPSREYVVQYQESDFAFIARLLEHEGIFFFFEHGSERDKLIIADDNRVFAPIEGHETIHYSPVTGVTDSTGAITALARTRTIVPRTVRVRDYNDRTPSVAIDATKDVDPTGRGINVRFGDHIEDPGDARRIAQIRAQEELCAKWVSHGASRVQGLRSGCRFALTDHFIAALDVEYVVTEVRHRARQEQLASEQGGGGYSNEFQAIPLSVTYRPQRITPRPKIFGVIHGRVDGPTPGTAAPIDNLGRYKVTLMIDEGAKRGGNATRWIRMAQLTAGSGFGTHFPLHIGAEVLITHIDGDPDRPVILASVPDAETVSPVTSANATQAILRTKKQIEIHLDDDA